MLRLGDSQDRCLISPVVLWEMTIMSEQYRTVDKFDRLLGDKHAL